MCIRDSPLIVCLLLAAILSVYFKTRQGLAIRATGDNEDMVRSSSVNADIYKCAGLALGNACVALSGGLIGQSLSFFDAGYGSGMVEMCIRDREGGEYFYLRKLFKSA